MTRTESKWVERVGRWRASGQSVTEYARGREFKAATLRWWSSRIGSGAVGSNARPQVARAPSIRMVRVVAAAPSAPSAVTVHVGVAHVEVHAGFDAALLREVVRALGGER